MTKPKAKESKSKNKESKSKNKESNTSLIPTAKYKRGDYDMLFSFKQYPVSDAYIEDLALKLVDWAESDPEALVLSQFFAAHRISNEAWHSWKIRSPMLLTAHKYALMCIGTRREVGGLKRKLDSSMVMRTMPQYSEEWKELNEWYSRMKEETSAQGNITVHMTPIPKLSESDKK